MASVELPAPVKITELPETPLTSGRLDHNDLPRAEQGGGEARRIRSNFVNRHEYMPVRLHPRT